MLTHSEREIVEKYIAFNTFTNKLSQIIYNNTSKISTLYRGIKIPKGDMQIGATYQSLNDVSSWTQDIDVAIHFSTSFDVLSGSITDLSDDVGYEEMCWAEIKEEQINRFRRDYDSIVMVWDDAEGLDVENHNISSSENEVIVSRKSWSVNEMKQVNNYGVSYYMVKVS